MGKSRYEEYSEEYDKILAEIVALEIKLNKLKEDYKSNCLFKPGDKVKVTVSQFHLTEGELPNKEITCFVHAINYGTFNNSKFLQMEFALPKKDGTKSSKSANITFATILNIEKVD